MRTAWVVVGYEGSGSVLIAQTVSHVIGSCAAFGDWHGYQFNRPMGSEGIVLHRSIPFMRPRQWHDDPAEFRALFPGYDRLRYIVTTRDLSVSVNSRIRRFGGTPEEYAHDNARTTRLLQKIVAEEDAFIWNYETMCALQGPYFQRLYDWLGVRSDFVPPLSDANASQIRPFEGMR